MKKIHIITILLIVLVLISGCSSDTEYRPPSQVQSTSDEIVSSESVKSVPSESKTKPEPPKTQMFDVGDTATDNELKVTLNNVKFVSKIDEQDNEFLAAEAPSGKKYAIVDITVENILSDKTQAISTLLETTVTDQDGYNYNLDFEGFTALDKNFKDGEIMPGMKKRGELAYLVPADATDLKFIYKFDLFTGKTAVFDIK